jgi:hypothetical protein
MVRLVQPRKLDQVLLRELARVYPRLDNFRFLEHYQDSIRAVRHPDDRPPHEGITTRHIRRSLVRPRQPRDRWVRRVSQLRMVDSQFVENSGEHPVSSRRQRRGHRPHDPGRHLWSG